MIMGFYGTSTSRLLDSYKWVILPAKLGYGYTSQHGQVIMTALASNPEPQVGTSKSGCDNPYRESSFIILEYM